MMMRYLGGGVGHTRSSLLDPPPPLENIQDEADLSNTVSTPWEQMQYHKNSVSDSDSEGDELSSSTPVDESEDAIDEGESEDAIDEGDEVYTY
jgi:hypothetical protein